MIFLKYIFPASVNPAPIQLGHIKKHETDFWIILLHKKIFLWEICLLNALIMRYYLGFLTV